jgi:uncharacterized protein (UPF0332 family)
MEQHPERSIRLAEEYLAAAKLALGDQLSNPAISLAIHSAIQAKDALYLKVKKEIVKPRSHGQAVKHLRSLGVLGEASLNQLSRLLASKSEAEYGQLELPILDAVESIRDAERFLETVKALLATN